DARTEAYVQKNASEVLKSLNNPDLSAAQRTAAFSGYMDKFTNLDAVSNFVIGKYSRRFTEAELTRYRKAFRAYALAVYEYQLDAYRGEAVVVGIGAQPARTLSLSLACARCLAVDTDAGRAAKLLAAARDAGRAAAVQTFVGAGGDPSVRAAVGEAIAQCDLLLLDVQDEAELLGALLAHAPRVRDGGRVAIVDRTFEFGERLPERRADQALRQLRELVLEPADARVERHGQAVAIHDFGMDRNVRARLCLLVPPAEAVPAQRSTYRGYTLHRLPDGWLAWPQAAGAFQHERLWRNEAPRCWFATDAAELRVRLEIADAAVAELAAARASFAQDRAAAAARVQAMSAGASVRAALLAALEVAPWCRELLLAAGTYELLVGEPSLGAAFW
ncbi:MAG: ABC transporter substrate-binding protein, partial [Gemmatimonas sp.]